MAEARLATFVMRNGERRTYQDVTRIDDSRPHLVLVYQQDALLAQLNKHDVVTHAFEAPAEAEEETAETAAES